MGGEASLPFFSAPWSRRRAGCLYNSKETLSSEGHAKSPAPKNALHGPSRTGRNTHTSTFPACRRRLPGTGTLQGSGRGAGSRSDGLGRGVRPGSDGRWTSRDRDVLDRGPGQKLLTSAPWAAEGTSVRSGPRRLDAPQGVLVARPAQAKEEYPGRIWVRAEESGCMVPQPRGHQLPTARHRPRSPTAAGLHHQPPRWFLNCPRSFRPLSG